MFVDEKCYKKIDPVPAEGMWDDLPFFSLSYGKCEICGDTGPCVDYRSYKNQPAPEPAPPVVRMSADEALDEIITVLYDMVPEYDRPDLEGMCPADLIPESQYELFNKLLDCLGYRDPSPDLPGDDN